MSESMQSVYLERVSLALRGPATIGVLFVAGNAPWITLEPEWKDNLPNISCIPLGKYLCKPFVSEKFGNTWELQKVEDRSAILFHVGNFRNDTEGCIVVGNKLGDVGILESRLAMARFRLAVPWPEQFWLTIHGNEDKFVKLED